MALFLPAFRADPAQLPVAIPIFKGIGLHGKLPGGTAHDAGEVSYRAASNWTRKIAPPAG
jgi:hypothetical protein